MPRERDQRRWPVEAVRRLQAAQQALASGLVGSLETALTMVRDGQPLPEPVEVPDDLAPIPDMTLPPDLYLELVVEEVRSLRTWSRPSMLSSSPCAARSRPCGSYLL